MTSNTPITGTGERDLSSAQARQVADLLMEETVDRPVFVRFAAALKARELRRLADRLDALAATKDSNHG